MAELDVEGIERATIAGVAPAKVVEIDGWLAAMDQGPILRAKSAVPLSHTVRSDGLAAIEAAYRTAGLPPAFRIAEVAGLADVRDGLTAGGYAAQQATLVKIGEVARLAALHDRPADLLERPDDAWRAVFMGEGFDPQDGAGRAAALTRSPDAVYAAVREDGRIVAVGAATFGHGWAGVHGMRTALDRRGRGYASRVLTALGRAIAGRGVNGVYLQVDEDNPARRLYRQAGFTEAWRYRYWRL